MVKGRTNLSLFTTRMTTVLTQGDMKSTTDIEVILFLLTNDIISIHMYTIGKLF